MRVNQHMADAEASSQGFLWVNKTIHSSALSNNKGDPARVRSVNKHVQRWRTRSSTGKKPAIQSGGPTVIGWRLDELPQRGKKSRHELITPAKATSNEAEQEQPDSALATILSDIPPSWGSPVDPFKSSSVPLTSEVFGFLRYFTESFLSAAIQTQVQNALSPKKLPTSEHIASKRIVQGCVADETHMYSVLALTSHQIKYLIGHKLPRIDGPAFYMAKALAGLRKSLDEVDAGALGQQAVLDTAWMGTAEAYMGNFAGALAHYRISLYIANRLGGFDKIDPFVREICRIGDIFISSLTLTSPIFGLVGDPGPISHDFRAEIERRVLPQRRMGIAFLEHGELWDEAMADFISEIVDLAQAAQFLWAFPDADVAAEDRDWVLQRSHALTYKSLGMVPESPVATLEEAIQECCRLCFVLWLFYVLAGTAGVPDDRNPGSLKRVRNIMPEHRRRLRESVERVDTLALDIHERRWGPYDDLMLWVLAFGTLSSKAEGCWFAGELAAEAKKRGIWTFDSLVGKIGGYLSLERLEILSGRRIARVLILSVVGD